MKFVIPEAPGRSEICGRAFIADGHEARLSRNRRLPGRTLDAGCRRLGCRIDGADVVTWRAERQRRYTDANRRLIMASRVT